MEEKHLENSLVEALVSINVQLGKKRALLEKGSKMMILQVEKLTLKKNAQPNYIYVTRVLTHLGVTVISLSTIMSQTAEVS